MKAKTRASIVDGLPVDLPVLHRAFRLQERAAGVGFDWPDALGPAAKVEEELAEVREELEAADAEQSLVEGEIGDLLFAVVNLSRKAGVHPALALERANEKFARRFQRIEDLAKQRGVSMREAGLEALDTLWEEAKLDE
jgi:MazG family protein